MTERPAPDPLKVIGLALVLLLVLTIHGVTVLYDGLSDGEMVARHRVLTLATDPVG